MKEDEDIRKSPWFPFIMRYCPSFLDYLEKIGEEQ